MMEGKEKLSLRKDGHVDLLLARLLLTRSGIFELIASFHLPGDGRKIARLSISANNCIDDDKKLEAAKKEEHHLIVFLFAVASLSCSLVSA